MLIWLCDWLRQLQTIFKTILNTRTDRPKRRFIENNANLVNNNNRN